MKRLICAILSVICLLFCFGGCSKGNNKTKQTFVTDYGMCKYGSYIYFRNGVGYTDALSKTNCKLARYNVNSGKISAACLDAACDHTRQSDCPFSSFTNLYHIEDDMIYFSAERGRVMVYSMDDESTRLVFDPAAFNAGRPYVFLSDKVYFVSMELVEGKESGFANNYIYHMCCVDYGASSSKKLFEIVPTYHQEQTGTALEYDESGNCIGERPTYDISATEFLHIFNGRIYFRDGESGNIYTTNMQGEEKTLLTAFEEFTLLGSCTVYNEYMLFLTAGASDACEYTYPSLDGKSHLTDSASRSKLYSLNMETAATTLLTDNASDYAVDQGKVYYYPWGYRFYGYQRDVAIRNYCSGELYSVNLDGTERELVYSDPNLLFLHYVVSKGTAFCLVMEYSEEGSGECHYAELNLKNKKLKYIN